MAINLVNTFSTSDVNLTNLMSTTDKLYNVSLSLTNMNNTTVPAIAHVSTLEVNGALYQTDAETAISTTDPVTSTTVADGTVYIMLTPSVSGTTCTAAFTATAPTWSDTKQGWYGTGSFANCKYVSRSLKNSASYINKCNIKQIKKNVPEIELPDLTIFAYIKSPNISAGNTTDINIINTKYIDNYLAFNSSAVFTAPFEGLYLIEIGRINVSPVGVGDYRYSIGFSPSSGHGLISRDIYAGGTDGDFNSLTMSGGMYFNYGATGKGTFSLTATPHATNYISAYISIKLMYLA